MILITGGAGFIGANFVKAWLRLEREPLVCLDKLTYAANMQSLAHESTLPGFTFARTDIGDRPAVRALLAAHKPRAVVHFAAESHVDRSIDSPGEFVKTNVEGTFNLIDEVRGYWGTLADEQKRAFRFLHVSTDEVYGSLGPADPAFSETTAYAPNSPYAASKASSDHIVRAYFHTYGLPVLTTNCSNNYGPLQFPEKLIPLVILNALAGKELPVYGDGKNVRDWLFVEDHCSAIRTVLANGTPGEVYNIGGNCERTNIEVVEGICAVLDELRPNATYKPHRSLIRFVKDRPGHDRRYAINASKIRAQLGWQPARTFETALRETVEWYLGNQEWVESIKTGAYLQWIEKQYGRRSA
jgi:dTDP-glucose 4,6-dehydratase